MNEILTNIKTNLINSVDSTSGNEKETHQTSRTSGLANVLQLTDNTPNEIFTFKEGTSGFGLISVYYFGVDKDHLFMSIERILDSLLTEEELFNTVDKNKILELIKETINKIPENEIPLSEEELTKRIRKILALEAMSGILEDLTPEQLEAFESSING